MDMGTTTQTPTYFVVYGDHKGSEWVLHTTTSIESAFAFFDSLNRQPGEWKSIRTRFINSNPWAV